MSNFWFHIRLLFVKKSDKEFFTFLYKTIGVCPRSLVLYRQCFIHRSSSKSHIIGSNERLEFLGDAILGSIIADFLYEKFPKEKEGLLTEMRSRIVNRHSMNAMGLDMHLQRNLLARVPNLKRNDAIGNCLEALIGAIYKDLGYTQTRKFIVKKIINPHFNVKQLPQTSSNYKSTLYQYCQQHKIELQVKTEAINDTNTPLFKAEIFINNEKVCEATGRSKKYAEQSAAHNTLKIKKIPYKNCGKQ